MINNSGTQPVPAPDDKPQQAEVRSGVNKAFVRRHSFPQNIKVPRVIWLPLSILALSAATFFLGLQINGNDADAQAQYDELLQKFQSREKEYSGLTSNYDALVQEHNALEQDYQVASENYTAGKNANLALQQELSDVTSALSAASDRISGLNNEIIDLRQELETVSTSPPVPQGFSSFPHFHGWLDSLGAPPLVATIGEQYLYSLEIEQQARNDGYKVFVGIIGSPQDTAPWVVYLRALVDGQWWWWFPLRPEEAQMTYFPDWLD